MSADTAFEVGRLYAPIKAISDILTSGEAAIFTTLPGIEGYYTMSMVQSSGNIINHTGGGNQLAPVGTVMMGYDGNSYVQFGSSANYLSKAGAYPITGLETFIEPALRGLTVGGWFKVDIAPVTASGLVSRDGIPANRGYSLSVQPGGLPRFSVSSNGTTVFSATGSAASISEWHFVTGRFTPSVEVAVFVDGTKTVNTTGIPASCNVSTQAFEVGRYLNSNSRVIDGKCRDLFVCWTALSDELIELVRLSSVP